MLDHSLCSEKCSSPKLQLGEPWKLDRALLSPDELPVKGDRCEQQLVWDAKPVAEGPDGPALVGRQVLAELVDASPNCSCLTRLQGACKGRPKFSKETPQSNHFLESNGDCLYKKRQSGGVQSSTCLMPCDQERSTLSFPGNVPYSKSPFTEPDAGS